MTVVLIDDDELVQMVWRIAAKSSGDTLKVYSSPAEFSRSASSFEKETPIYIDSGLGGGARGEEFAKELHSQGFMNLYLATGRSRDSFPPMPWLKGIVGKEAPWS